MYQRSTLYARFASHRVVVLVSTLFGLAGITVAGDTSPRADVVQATDQVLLSVRSITLPYTITQSGSYRLTSNLIGSSGSAGIIIDADNVTLDLSGFSVVGAPETSSGVKITAAADHVRVFNGFITGWGQHGVEALGNWIDLDGIQLDRNGASCARIGGSDGRIEACHFSGCVIGLEVIGTRNLIAKNSASSNAVDYRIGADNAFGVIVTVGGPGGISAISDGKHPWTNFGVWRAPATEPSEGLDND